MPMTRSGAKPSRLSAVGARRERQLCWCRVPECAAAEKVFGNAQVFIQRDNNPSTSDQTWRTDDGRLNNAKCKVSYAK